MNETDLIYQCPYCGQRFSIEESSDSYLVSCPYCGKELDLTELVPDETHLADATGGSDSIKGEKITAGVDASHSTPTSDSVGETCGQQVVSCPGCGKELNLPELESKTLVARGSEEGLFKIHCTHCGQHLAGDISLAGLTIECPTCKKPVELPDRGTIEFALNALSSSTYHVERFSRKPVITACAIILGVVIITVAGVSGHHHRKRRSSRQYTGLTSSYTLQRSSSDTARSLCQEFVQTFRNNNNTPCRLLDGGTSVVWDVGGENPPFIVQVSFTEDGMARMTMDNTFFALSCLRQGRASSGQQVAAALERSYTSVNGTDPIVGKCNAKAMVTYDGRLLFSGSIYVYRGSVSERVTRLFQALNSARIRLYFL